MNKYRELYISDARDQFYKMRDPLEASFMANLYLFYQKVLRKLSQSKFCAISNLVIMDNFILNEQTIDYYLCKIIS